MSSLRGYQCNPARVVQKAKMIFSASGRHTFVVEGDTDFRLYRQWLVDDNACLENVNNKSQVKDVWKEAKRRGLNSIHCLADLDYDLVVNNMPILDAQFVYVSMRDGETSSDVECNDLESVLIRSHALSKVMAQKYRGSDLYGDEFTSRVSDLRERLRIASRNVGAFRAADQKYWRLHNRSPIGDNFNIEDTFFNAEKLDVDVSKLTQVLRRSSRQGINAMDEVIETAEKYIRDFSDGWQLSRGHDLTSMLAQHLAHLLNRRVISSRDVEEDLRMACELEMVKETQFGAKLMKIGEAAGKPFLKASF